LPAKLIIGVVSALLLVSTALDLGPAVRAGLHDGARGMWVATAKTCRGSACVWTGKFVRPDGHVVVTGAHYAGALPVGIRAGTSVPALFTGSGLVFPTTGSDLWIELLITLVVSVLGLSWASHAWVAKRLSRPGRTGVPAPGDHG
jgi:hypothetical protein